jgi:cytochrome c
MKGMVAGVAVAAIALMGWGLRPVAAQDDAARPEFYSTKVEPIFQANCYRCHGGMNHRGGLNIATKAGMLRGGHDGAVLVPGDPARSLLVRLIRHEGPANDPKPMPPSRPKLSDADIAVVEQWVRAGAIMPEDVPKP